MIVQFRLKSNQLFLQRWWPLAKRDIIFLLHPICNAKIFWERVHFCSSNFIVSVSSLLFIIVGLCLTAQDWYLEMISGHCCVDRWEWINSCSAKKKMCCNKIFQRAGWEVFRHQKMEKNGPWNARVEILDNFHAQNVRISLWFVSSHVNQLMHSTA